VAKKLTDEEIWKIYKIKVVQSPESLKRAGITQEQHDNYVDSLRHGINPDREVGILSTSPEKDRRWRYSRNPEYDARKKKVSVKPHKRQLGKKTVKVKGYKKIVHTKKVKMGVRGISKLNYYVPIRTNEKYDPNTNNVFIPSSQYDVSPYQHETFEADGKEYNYGDKGNKAFSVFLQTGNKDKIFHPSKPSADFVRAHRLQKGARYTQYNSGDDISTKGDNCGTIALDLAGRRDCGLRDVKEYEKPSLEYRNFIRSLGKANGQKELEAMINRNPNVRFYQTDFLTKQGLDADKVYRERERNNIQDAFARFDARKKSTRKDYLKGGLADKRNYSKFNKKQLSMGTKVEMEHTNKKKLAREIAGDHLAEHPRYYTALKKMEKELETKNRRK